MRPPDQPEARRSRVRVDAWAPRVFTGICALWLLLLAGAGQARGADGLQWEASATGRSAALLPRSPHTAGFRLVPAQTSGLAFTNRLAKERFTTNQIYLNGSGVALGDVDGDGWCDVYFCGLDGDNALFRNRGGWRFDEITAAAGVACPGVACTGAALADVDGDGDLDLIVNSVGQGSRIFLNDGQAHFVLGPAGILNPARGGTSSALADFDGDGDLDLYVANYRTDTLRDMPNAKLQGEDVGGRKVVTRFEGRPTTDDDLAGRFELSPTGSILEHGEADLFLRNVGGGRFEPVSFTGGAFLDEAGQPLAAPPYDWGLSVIFRDLNADGRPDLYVCNDFETPDRCWINQGDGRFRTLPATALRHTSIFSMGGDVGDLNRDGFDDLFVSDMLMQDHASRQLRIGDVPPVPYRPGLLGERPQYSFNTLQLNRGDNTYAEIAWYAGAEASGWTWCPVLLDVDLDGFEDILFTTGHEWDMMNGDVIERGETLKAQQRLNRLELLRLRNLFSRFNTPNVAFRNLGNLRFAEMSTPWGLTDRAVSQGVALADLDGDGDLDAVMNNLNDVAAVYENLSSAPRVAVRLKGIAPNTRGIGARLFLRGGAVPAQSQVMVCGGRYLSADDALRVFAAGSPTNALQLEVQWAGGRKSLIPDVRADRVYEVDEAAATAGGSTAAAESARPWFEAVADFAPVHKEEAFDDLARQPLIPFLLSGLGPGVAWADLDRDGWEDLVLGAGRGSALQAFHNDGAGHLLPWPEPVFARTVGRDLAGLAVADGTLMAASANYEDGFTNGGWIRIFDRERKVAGESVLGPTSSAGPLALADIDGDGDLDLFVGGRAVAGRYPEPADSLLLRNEGGRLIPAQRFAKLGLVSGAVFADLEGDGRPDLVLAVEWGPVRVFHNDPGSQFRETTGEWGLANLTGWWRGVTSGDFDGDGRLDLVASNWGLNSRYQADAGSPSRLYYTDLDGDLILDLVEARTDPASGQELPTRGLRMVGMALPWLRDQIGSYEAYGKATIADLYGDRLRAAARLEVTTLASTVFLNRGDHFEPRELPAPAQWAAGFAVCVGDADGDGREDLFLSQNFFGVPPDGVRQDAGRGLWLQGDGQGGFRALAGQESGVVLYGEQRGAALADYDADGRVDLVVAQNSQKAALFHNTRARPGLRVRLQGPPGNLNAIGAVLRVRTSVGLGAAREIHAGSGYWSQDGATQVMAVTGDSGVIEVRWPGGLQTSSQIPPGAREVVLDATGGAKVTR